MIKKEVRERNNNCLAAGAFCPRDESPLETPHCHFFIFNQALMQEEMERVLRGFCFSISPKESFRFNSRLQ